jgi:transposase
MSIHKNARLTPVRREEMALSVTEGSLSKADAARIYGVSPKIVARWVERYKTEGGKGMADRSPRPHVMPGLTSRAVAERIVLLRRQRLTGTHIALEVGVSTATVSRVLRRAGLSRLKDLAPAEPVRRYEHEHPGDMIHIDIKKLGPFERVGHRITGDRTGQSNSRGVAGSSFMSASMTLRASPSRKYCPTSARKAPSPSSRQQWPTMPALVSQLCAS